jgi:effector-binding domain-containing protein
MKRGLNVVEHEAVHGMAIRRTVPATELPQFFAQTFGRVGEYIGRKGGKFTGPPFAVYHKFGAAGVDVEAGFPVVFDVLENVPMEGDIHPVDYPGGEALEYVYFGAYDGMQAAYAEVERWLKEHGKTAGGPPCEVYYSEPQTDPAETETHIVQPFN